MGPRKMKEKPEKSTKKRKAEEDEESGESESEPGSNRSKRFYKENGEEETNELDFASKAETKDGKPWNLKICSWNVNGIRAWLGKDGLAYIRKENPDIITLQETKCSDDKIPKELKDLKDYRTYFLAGDQDGYSGVCLFSKKEPLSVKNGTGVEEHDKEGRAITAEYDEFYLVCTYVPNAGRKLVRLDYRMKWDEDFREYLKRLEETKPVILCGDLNVAHNEIDIANPKNNKRNAGFTQEERDGFSKLLDCGFVDSFRQLYPDRKAAYTFWTYMMNARAKNVGWRLDYFVISKALESQLCDSIIRSEVYGSDHCPITLLLAV